LFVAAGGVLRC